MTGYWDINLNQFITTFNRRFEAELLYSVYVILTVANHI